MKMIPINEANKKYERKYQCPYCAGKYIRTRLPSHIDNKHSEMIPEGYTALRITFNVVNKKETSYCIVCRREAPWNETKGRYDRLCGRQECVDAYKKMAHRRNKDVYGVEVPQSDKRYNEEIQKKALANRRISGTYKFEDGGVVEYTGSYEKKLLEFMDKIIHINSYDIEAPAPSIYYSFNGATHLYIPDYLYIPYNLIIEIKDGGNNPNKNKEMAETRAKTVAKEKAIIESGKYNYIRLSNNDFSKLMEAFAVLKYRMDDEEEAYIRIYENVVLENSAINAALPSNLATDTIVSNNIMMLQFAGEDGELKYALTADPQAREYITIEKNGKYKINKNNLEDDKYVLYKMNNKTQAKELYEYTIHAIKNNKREKESSTDYFYRKYTGNYIITEDQILFDSRFTPMKSMKQEIQSLSEQVIDYIKYGDISLIESMINDIEKETYCGK